MHKFLVIALVLMVGSAVAWFSGLIPHGSSDEVVALVDGDPITVDQYRSEYIDYLLQAGLQDDIRLRHSFLDRMIDMRILTLYGRDSLRLAEDPGLLLEMDRARRKLLIEGYLRRVVYDTLKITESDLEEMFVRINTQLKASHLYARTLEEAVVLRGRLESGESFEALAREVFADPQLAQSGGSLGYFGYDEMDSALEEAAYSMAVGEISEPVQTANGYSIIRLDDRAVKPLLTENEFATRRDRVYTYVDYRKKLAARKAVRDAILESARPEFVEPVLDALVETQFGRNAPPWSELADNDSSIPAVVLTDGQLSLAEVVEEAQFISERQRDAGRDREGAMEVLKGLVVRRELVRRAREDGIHELEEFAGAVRSEHLKQLYEHAWNHVRADTEVPEDSVRDYFDRHQAEFSVPERVHVREIVLESNKKAQSLMRTLNAANFASKASVHSVRPGADNSGGDLGFVTREQMGILADDVFAAAPGTLLGPLEVKGRYAVFLVGERQPSRFSTLRESRDAIRALLFDDIVRKAVESRVSDARGHYDVDKFLDRVETIELRTLVST